MGCCMSGEALDTICLAKELANMYSSSNNMAVSFYRRYRDDTFVLDTSFSVKDIIDNIVRFSKFFPSRIPLTFNISIFLGSFLDCSFFKNVSTNSYTTYTRFNTNVPSSIPDQSISTYHIH